MADKVEELVEDNEEQIRKAKRIMKNWSNLETIITTISSRFLGEIDINIAISDALHDMGVLTGASRAFLFLFNENKSLLNNTHEWCAEGITPQIDKLQDLKSNAFPWLIEELNHGKIINVKKLSSLPNAAKSIKELLEIQNVKSLLVFPLYIKSELRGMLGFNKTLHDYEWQEMDCSLLRVSSQIIGNALELVKIQQTLRASEDNYRLLADNINDIIFILNLKYKFEYANQSNAFKLLGYQKEEVIGKSALSFIHPDDFENVIKIFEEGFNSSKPKSEIRFQDCNGNWIWFECSGKSFNDERKQKKCLIILQNISERKLVEERYKNLFENSPNAILLLDFKGTILDSNSTVKKLFGFEKNYFINKSINEFERIFQLEVKQFFKKIFQASFVNDFPDPIEIQIRNSEKKDLWVEIQASTIKQKNKTLIQLIFQDITEKKKAELLEERFKEELEKEVEERTKNLNLAFKQQKLYLDQILKSSQFKTEFMATMSHELRTPLNAIIGFADLLIEGVYGSLNKEQQEFIRDIKSSAEHQFDMIKHILDISKVESGQITLNIQKFSLNTVVEQIKSNLRPMYAKKNLKFKVRGLDKDVFIFADPIRFKEILLNLLSNAIKFTIQGKVILSVKEEYNQWLFKVTDTGIGIATKDAPLVFREFKRVDSAYVRSVPGTGLGLSLTKRLVELHGGEINFFSLLGVGTTFTFSISKKLETKLKKG
jgi:PAS domain S-box-containing protein